MRSPAWENASAVVFVGRQVAKAFGFKWLEPCALVGFLSARTLYGVLPHPSGVNHWYNEKSNRDQAEVFLEEVLGR